MALYRAKLISYLASIVALQTEQCLKVLGLHTVKAKDLLLNPINFVISWIISPRHCVLPKESDTITGSARRIDYYLLENIYRQNSKAKAAAFAAFYCAVFYPAVT